MSELQTTTRPANRSPQNLLGAISWMLLLAVMFGGYSLLRLINAGDQLSDFQEQFFRAGHAHAGVLAAIGLLYSSYLGRTQLSYRNQVIAWGVYVAGVVLMSGGFFLHMIVGEPGSGSAGTTMTVVGALVLAGAITYLAWHLFRARHTDTIEEIHHD